LVIASGAADEVNGWRRRQIDMIALATMPASDQVPSARPASVLVQAYDRVVARKAAEKAAAALPSAGAPRVPATVALQVERPASGPAPAAAVDQAAELALAWDRFGAAGVAAGERYDLACRISALSCGGPTPLSSATAEGRAARVAEIQAALEATADPRARGKLAGQLSALQRGEMPVPELGLTADACRLRNDHLSKEIAGTADPMRKRELVKALVHS
jgi:hypothetical protein